MADFVALEWGFDHVSVIEARATKDSIRVQKAFRFAWPEEGHPRDNADTAGATLREQLKQHGVHARKVVVCFPREEVVARRLELPVVPAAELPALVKLQAATKTTSGLDSLHLDFLPLPRSSDATSQDVLMVTVSKPVATRVRQVCSAAGLDLISLGLGSVGAAALVARAQRDQRSRSRGASLVVVRDATQVEISIMREGQLLFTHAAEVDDDAEQAGKSIITQASRLRVAQERLLGGMQITDVWLIGGDAEYGELSTEFAKALDCEVHLLDPLGFSRVPVDATDLPSERGPFAGPIGSLLVRAQNGFQSIDFLAPRKPVVKNQNKKLKAALIAAGVLLLVATGYATFKMRQADLDTRIAELESQTKEKERLIAKGRPTLEAAQEIESWRTSDLHMLEEMQEIDEALPHPDLAYLQNYRINTNLRDSQARIRANGRARDRFEVEALNDRMVSKDYELLPASVTTDRRDPQYPVRFDLDLTKRDEKPEDSATVPTGFRTRRR